MPDAFEETSLWRRTLGATDGVAGEARTALRAAYLQFRTVVAPLASEISQALPMFTDHSLEHIDALWDTASLICGDAFPINPAEAFVLGGAFLLHDLGMGLASFRNGLSDIEQDWQFNDLLVAAVVRARRADPPAEPAVIEEAARRQAVIELLRLRHAAQAERLVREPFHTSDGDTFYLLQDAQLRHNFGSLIGRIAHSHWWDVAELRDLEERQGSCVDHPPEWEVDPLKVACVLRLADAAHIDQRRSPLYLHAFRRPERGSRDHWYFQERLTRPRIDGDRMIYTATQPFRREEAGAWWLAQETVRMIDDQLRRVDALCADLGRPRFPVRSVAGADSPERLARYIPTDGWEPIDADLRVSDATRLVANLGGEDLYGRRPEVALRELIANAADATQARRLHEGGGGAPVTVRLAKEDGSWYLTVSDQGIGMSRETMISALTDFGYSRWQDAALLKDFPGLLAKGFQATGRFGIGFFAVFMVADEVEVRSLAYGEGLGATHVLEFREGLATRPILRRATEPERLRSWGTTVRLKLRHDPRSSDGLFKTAHRRLTHTQLLHSRVTRLCALSDVHIDVCGPDDAGPVRLINGGDWISIPPDELFRRLYRREKMSHLDRMIIDGYEKLFAERAEDLYDESGAVIGRAMVATGWESVYPDMYWMRPPEGQIYVGGLHADTLDYVLGAFVGTPLTADRLRAFPVASLAELHRWLEAQAEAVAATAISNGIDRWMLSQLIRGFGTEAPNLACVVDRTGMLNRTGLTQWLDERNEILLVSNGSLEWVYHSERPPLFLAFDGRVVDPPENVIFVSLNPMWLFPEEVLPPPRDERFADTPEPLAGWDVRTWWYDTGNFGTPGLVVRTIAETWGVDVVDLLNLMEPLHVQGDQDLRPVLPTQDGKGLRATAIRVRRPQRQSY